MSSCRIRVLAACVFVTFLMAGACDSSPGGREGRLGTVSVSGRHAFRNGQSLEPQPVTYRLTVGGRELFADGVLGCHHTDPRMAGVVRKDGVRGGDGGAYSVGFAFSEATSVVDPGCGASRLEASRLESLRLDASVPADARNCRAYCAFGAQEEAGVAACEQDCASGGRIIHASKTLTRGEVDRWLATRDGNGDFTWTQELVFDALGPPVSQGAGPDLAVDAEAARTSVRVSEEVFAADDCAILEGCLGGAGKRKLVRFDGIIRNVGQSALELGDPAGNPRFEHSGCHNHYHLSGMMMYELVHAGTGRPVVVEGNPVVGRKQGFCMMDMSRVQDAAEGPSYSCEFQGLSPGWADSYEGELDCQWVDVTGVPSGDYELRLTVNPDSAFFESDTSNNAASVPVRIE